MKNITLFFYLIIFAILAVISVNILRSHTQNTNALPANTLEDFGNNIIFTEYDDKGTIKYILTMQNAKRYLQSGETLMIQPRLKTIATSTQPAWHMRANQGIANKAGDQVILTGNIIIHQLPIPKHPEMTMKTTTLTVYTKTSQAHTDAPVTIIRPGTIIHGVGMNANLKTGEYQLLSQTNATIDLSHQPKK